MMTEAMSSLTLDVARGTRGEPNETRERKVCACCKKSYSLREFQQLPICGFFGDPTNRAELRNCPCTNTIAILHTPKGVVMDPQDF